MLALVEVHLWGRESIQHTIAMASPFCFDVQAKLKRFLEVGAGERGGTFDWFLSRQFAFSLLFGFFDRFRI